MTTKKDWKYTYASVLGSSHKKSHTPCQDSSKCQVIQDAYGEEVLIAVVSDGAGSAKFSDLGSSIACSLFVKEVTKYFSEKKRVKDLKRTFFEKWIDQYQDVINSHAKDFSIREFACTLVAAVVGNDHAAFFQIGDGAIVVLDPESENGIDNYNWTFWPAKGEYENTTFFITDPKIKKNIQFDVLSKKIEEVSLFTDGIQHLSLHYQSKTVHHPFFKPMFNILRQANNGEDLNSSLEKFLSSDRMNEKTDDDKTLLLASRKRSRRMVTAKTIPKYKDINGNVIKIGKMIGKGGEGTVYEVQGKPGTVLKIYHKFDEERSKKIKLMTKLKNENLLKYTAWPIETVKDESGKVIGFLMPSVRGKEVHILYSPKNRLNEFDHVSIPFLIHTAANIARAFAVVHNSGQVIGDVNHGNILVSKDGTIRLIDCDSFQIGRNGNLFLCKVGVGTHQPPELQSKSLSNLIRTTNHDLFGLAIIIFQLLFMGRHPFSGQFIGNIEMPIEKAIEQYRFAYGKNAKQRQIKQPPGTLPLDFYSKELAGLFEKAFSQASTHNRPKAIEWIEALEKLNRELIHCPINQAHTYNRIHHQCPWCEYETKTGLVLFSTIITKPNNNNTFELDTIWKRISDIPPLFNQELPDPYKYLYSPLEEMIKSEKRFKRIKTIRILEAIMIGIISILLTVYGEMGFYPLGGLIVSVLVGSRKIKTNRFKKIYNEYERINQKWESVLKRWEKEASTDPFYTKLHELKKYKSKYEELSLLHDQKLKQLEKSQKYHHFYDFLDKFTIQSCKIDHIGPNRKAILQLYGIQTAKDISKESLLKVPGFGPFIGDLIEWRKNIEKHFSFDPKKGIPKSDLYNLEQEMYILKCDLEKKITDGETELNHIKTMILTSRENLFREAEECLQILSQLKAYVKS